MKREGGCEGGGGGGGVGAGGGLSNMKVPQQCFPVVRFLMLYKVIQAFESVKEIFNFAHSNKSLVQGGSNY